MPFLIVAEGTVFRRHINQEFLEMLTMPINM